MAPGGLVHIQIKKPERFTLVYHPMTVNRTGQSISRGERWQYVQIAHDGVLRIAVTVIYPGKKAVCAAACLRAAVACYQSLSIMGTRAPPNRD